MKAWVVIDVGCLECGVDHEVVGTFATEEDAEKAATTRDEKTDGWRDGGQTSAHVFAIDVPCSSDPLPGSR